MNAVIYFSLWYCPLFFPLVRHETYYILASLISFDVYFILSKKRRDLGMTRSTHFNLYFLAFLIHYVRERERERYERERDSWMISNTSSHFNLCVDPYASMTITVIKIGNYLSLSFSLNKITCLSLVHFLVE